MKGLDSLEIFTTYIIEMGYLSVHSFLSLVSLAEPAKSHLNKYVSNQFMSAHKNKGDKEK